MPRADVQSNDGFRAGISHQPFQLGASLYNLAQASKKLFKHDSKGRHGTIAASLNNLKRSVDVDVCIANV